MSHESRVSTTMKTAIMLLIMAAYTVLLGTSQIQTANQCRIYGKATQNVFHYECQALPTAFRVEVNENQKSLKIDCKHFKEQHFKLNTISPTTICGRYNTTLALFFVRNCPLAVVNVLAKIHPAVASEISNITFEDLEGLEDRAVTLPGPFALFPNLTYMEFNNVANFKFQGSLQDSGSAATNNRTNGLEIVIKNSDMTKLPSFSQYYAKKMTSLTISSWEKLTDLTSIGSLPRLQQLTLNRNHKLKSLEPRIFANNVQLTNLNLYDNRFETIDKDTLAGLVNLKILNLGYNKFKSIPIGFFAKAPNLTDIDWDNDMCHNRRRTLPASMLTPSNNKLKRFKFRLLEQSCHLLISPGAFSAMQFDTVEDLVVRNTQLGYDDLVKGFVRNFTNLRRLEIDDNKLEKLRGDDFNHAIIQDLKLADNNYNCECQTLLAMINLNDDHLIDDIDFDKKIINNCPTTRGPSNMTVENAFKSLQHCRLSETIVIVIVIGVTLASMLIVLLLVAVLYKARIWLYSHHIFHKIFPNDVAGADLQYDIFISYAEADSDIASQLYNDLINGTRGRRVYQVVMDVVNFELGVPVAAEIDRFIGTSRKTIALVSDNYLKDAFCMHAFGVAKSKNRLIVVLVNAKSPADLVVNNTSVREYCMSYTYLRKFIINMAENEFSHLPARQAVMSDCLSAITRLHCPDYKSTGLRLEISAAALESR
jgi:Leucine-rich repeat (LRR) protein